MIDGHVIKGEKRRQAGLHPNAAMCADPTIKNSCMFDSVGGSVLFYDTPIRLDSNRSAINATTQCGHPIALTFRVEIYAEETRSREGREGPYSVAMSAERCCREQRLRNLSRQSFSA
jgi:hypothetical protein